MLDVGVGTGLSLLTHANVLKAKNMIIVRLETDAAFIDQCCHKNAAAKMKSHVRAVYLTDEGFQFLLTDASSHMCCLVGNIFRNKEVKCVLMSWVL